MKKETCENKKVQRKLISGCFFHYISNFTDLNISIFQKSSKQTMSNKFIAVSKEQNDLIIELVKEELANIERGFDISIDKGKWKRASDQLNALGPRKGITQWKKVGKLMK